VFCLCTLTQPGISIIGEPTTVTTGGSKGPVTCVDISQGRSSLINTLLTGLIPASYVQSERTKGIPVPLTVILGIPVLICGILGIVTVISHRKVVPILGLSRALL